MKFHKRITIQSPPCLVDQLVGGGGLQFQAIHTRHSHASAHSSLPRLRSTQTVLAILVSSDLGRSFPHTQSASLPEIEDARENKNRLIRQSTKVEELDMRITKSYNLFFLALVHEALLLVPGTLERLGPARRAVVALLTPLASQAPVPVPRSAKQSLST